MAEHSKPRFVIASEVGGAKRLEAASKKDKMSATSGWTVGSPSQQFVVRVQTSSERPGTSRFGGRGGHLPLRTRISAAKGGICANGTSCAKICKSAHQYWFLGERDGASLQK